MQSTDFEIHMRQVAAFWVLPSIYPSGQKRSAEDNAWYTPIAQDIVEGVTHELTPEDIKQDPNWIAQLTCIVTSNVDRAIINAVAAKAFGNHSNVRVLRWCQLRQEFPRSVQAILYDEEERPELFAYFVQGCSGQVLDNAHGNVYFGVANGTPCTMQSFAWDDPDDERTALQTIAKSTLDEVVDLPTPPDHIIVDIKPQPGTQWPTHLNLAPNSNLIRIPIGLTS